MHVQIAAAAAPGCLSASAAEAGPAAAKEQHLPQPRPTSSAQSTG